MYLISADQDLNLFKECERCFWLNYKSRLPRPAPEPSLFERATRAALHRYFDKYRGAIPPDMKGELDGSLVADEELISHWRNWRTGLRRSDTVMSAVLYGAMDDCLVEDKELYIPVQFCLTLREPSEDELKRQERLLEGIAYLLTANGYKTLEMGYAIYYFPQSIEQHRSVTLKKKVVRFDADLMRAERLFYAAADVLRRRTPPDEEKGCAVCAWFKARASIA